MVTPGEMKEYLRVDGTDDDALIGSLIKAAEEYVTEQTGIDFSTEQIERADLAVKILVTRWYENRDSQGKPDNLTHGIDSILFQLRWRGGGTA